MKAFLIKAIKVKKKLSFFVELEKFAGLTSSIGNFIVLPKKCRF